MFKFIIHFFIFLEVQVKCKQSTRFVFIPSVLLGFCLLLASCSLVPEKADQANKSQTAKPEIESLGPQLTVKNLSFQDVTERVGLGSTEAENLFLIDLNFDGYSDLVLLPKPYGSPQFYLYDAESSEFVLTSLIGKGFHFSFLNFNDFDGDKVTDLIAGSFFEKSETIPTPLTFFKGKIIDGKIHFKKLTGIIPQIKEAITSIIPLDYDLDGDLDLFVSRWFDKEKNTVTPHPDYFFENNNGKFSDKSAELLVDEYKKVEGIVSYPNSTPSYAAASCDLNDDMYPDILVTSTNNYGNKLWLNSREDRGTKRFFNEVGQVTGFKADPDGLLNKKGGGRSFGVACADYNNDHIMDVYIAEVYHSYDAQSVDKSSVLTGATRQQLPSYIRTEYTLDSSDVDWHQSDRRAVWFDFNLDGRQDLLVDNFGYPPSSRLILFENLADFSMVNRAQDLGIDNLNPLATVVFDYNKDGKIDILTSAHNLRLSHLKSRLFLYENNYPVEGKMLTLHLRGKKSNHLAVGAKVALKLKRDGELYERRRIFNPTHGAFSPQSAPYVMVPILPGETLRKITVHWPVLVKGQVLTQDFQIDLTEKNFEWTLCEGEQVKVGFQKCEE